MTHLEAGHPTHAKMFAVIAHSAVGQTRKYTGEPYSNHSIRVYELLQKYTSSNEMLCAALLHDVMEDCTTRMVNRTMLDENIGYAFGGKVSELVWHLTDYYTKDTYPDLNREERKLRERARQAQLPPDAQTIKYCDILDNTEDILKHDPGFARIYLQEISDLLEVMNQGDPRAYADAQAAVANATRVLAGLA